MIEENKKTNNIDMTEGSVLKLLLVFSIPVLASGILQQFYTTTDVLILGQFAGKIGLSAIDSVFNLLKLPVNFFIGVSTGATIIISQYFGAKKNLELNRTIHNCIWLSFTAGIILSFVIPSVILLVEIWNQLISSCTR